MDVVSNLNLNLFDQPRIQLITKVKIEHPYRTPELMGHWDTPTSTNMSHGRSVEGISSAAHIHHRDCLIERPLPDNVYNRGILDTSVMRELV